MAIKPIDAAALSANIVDMYSAAEQHLLQLMAQHVKQGIDQPDDWTHIQLSQVEVFKAQAQAVMKDYTAQAQAQAADDLATASSDGGLVAMTDIASALGQDFDVNDYRPPANTTTLTALSDAMDGGLTQTQFGVLRSTDDAYRQVIASYAGLSAAGGATPLVAAQKALDDFAGKGITGFEAKNGAQWQLGSYVDMAMRTALTKAYAAGHAAQLGELGYDLVVVSDVPQECELCRPFEGQILSLSGDNAPDSDGGDDPQSVIVSGEQTVSDANQNSSGSDNTDTADASGDAPVVLCSLDEAIGDGFLHPNCRHSYTAYIPGHTPVVGQGETADPVGDAERQQLRYLERAVRAWKRRAAVGLTPDAVQAATLKAEAYSTRIKQLVDTSKSGLTRQRYRESISSKSLFRTLPKSALTPAQYKATLAGTPKVKQVPKIATPKVTAPPADVKTWNATTEPPTVLDLGKEADKVAAAGNAEATAAHVGAAKAVSLSNLTDTADQFVTQWLQAGDSAADIADKLVDVPAAELPDAVAAAEHVVAHELGDGPGKVFSTKLSLNYLKSTIDTAKKSLTDNAATPATAPLAALSKDAQQLVDAWGGGPDPASDAYHALSTLAESKNASYEEAKPYIAAAQHLMDTSAIKGMADKDYVQKAISKLLKKHPPPAGPDAATVAEHLKSELTSVGYEPADAGIEGSSTKAHLDDLTTIADSAGSVKLLGAPNAPVLTADELKAGIEKLKSDNLDGMFAQFDTPPPDAGTILSKGTVDEATAAATADGLPGLPGITQDMLDALDPTTQNTITYSGEKLQKAIDVFNSMVDSSSPAGISAKLEQQKKVAVQKSLTNSVLSSHGLPNSLKSAQADLTAADAMQKQYANVTLAQAKASPPKYLKFIPEKPTENVVSTGTPAATGPVALPTGFPTIEVEEDLKDLPDPKTGYPGGIPQMKLALQKITDDSQLIHDKYVAEGKPEKYWKVLGGATKAKAALDDQIKLITPAKALKLDYLTDEQKVQLQADLKTFSGYHPFTSGSQGRQWGTDFSIAKGDYTTAEQRAVARYSTTAGYTVINTALRQVAGDKSLLDGPIQLKTYTGQNLNESNASVKQFITGMDSAMARNNVVPEAQIVTRGTEQIEFKALGVNNNYENVDLTQFIGREYTADSYTSTSVRGTAAMSGKDVQIQILLQPGQRAVHMAGDVNYVGAMSTYASEDELLLARNTRFRILDVRKDGGVWKVKTLALGDDTANTAASKTVAEVAPKPKAAPKPYDPVAEAAKAAQAKSGLTKAGKLGKLTDKQQTAVDYLVQLVENAKSNGMTELPYGVKYTLSDLKSVVDGTNYSPAEIYAPGVGYVKTNSVAVAAKILAHLKAKGVALP